MASDEASEISTQSGETSTEQPEESLADQQMVASTEVASTRSTESNCESQSGDSRDSETTSDNSGSLKVAVVASLAGLSHDFGQSTATKTHLTTMES
jgi:hypothetical protein